MSSATLRNAADTWINQANASKNYNQKPRMQLQTSSGNNKYALQYFSRPFPYGANIINAKLQVYAHDAWSGSNTLTAQRISTKWSVNKVHYPGPSVAGVTASSATLSNTAANALYEIDVTAIIQAISNGAAWYGLRISTSQTSVRYIHSSQSPQGAYRPVLIITWSDAPDEPDSLRPAGGRSISQTKPYLAWSFSDVSGDQNLDNIQVQFGASQALLDAGTATWDSGTVDSDEPNANLSDTTKFPTFAALAADSSNWWRVRNQDGAGLWSPWADSQNFVVTTKGVLTITAPTGSIKEGSPAVTWTFTGRTQKAYQVILSTSDDLNTWLWDSGKITDTDQSITIPFGEIEDPSLTYVIRVRVWDTINRESVPGDAAYVEASTGALAVTTDGTVSAVTSLAAASDIIVPKMILTWSRTTAPDSFQLQRSDDNGATWYYFDEVTPGEVSTGGTNYSYTDLNAKQYVQHQWRVFAVVGGKQSNPATVSGVVTRLCPILVRPWTNDVCFFMNPERSRQRLSIQGLHERMAGPPVLVTQRLGGQTGTVSGRFIDEAPGQGYTAYKQYKSFLAMEKDSGLKMVLYVANQTFDVVAFNFNIDVLTDTSGISYQASFDWIQV